MSVFYDAKSLLYPAPTYFIAAAAAATVMLGLLMPWADNITAGVLRLIEKLAVDV